MAEYQETIFLSNEAYFDALLADIAQAKNQIDMEVYIFQNDAIGKRVTQALIEAGQRGVRVRLLVDGIGSPGWSNLLKLLNSAGVEARVFRPLPWKLWQWQQNLRHRSDWLSNMLYLFAKMNKRNHRKTCLIDTSIVYIGSTNIHDCHLNTPSKGQGWRDTSVRLVGAKTKNLQEAFAAVWNHPTIQKRLSNIFERINTNAIIRLNYSRHERRVLYKSLLQHLSRCKKRVWITNAYFVPDNRLLNKLADLAEKDIDVRILLPQKTDIFLLTWASKTFYDKLLKSGVRIFEYMPTMLHAKSLILDDWFIVGSSNLNQRSLLHDLDVDVNIRSETAKQALEQQFLVDISHSTEIHWLGWQKSSWLKKFLGRLSLYIKYWM